jgi:hypothetical protein
MGQAPPQALYDQLNYLRQLDVPPALADDRSGRGNRREYGFYDLVECGVALQAIRNGMKPADFKRYFVGQRKEMHRHFRDALKNMPEAALDEPWIKSRGQVVPVKQGEIWLRLHDRYAEQPGRIEARGVEERNPPSGSSPFDLVERFPGERLRVLVPLTRLVLQWTRSALEAPPTRPGPQ